MPAPGPRPAQAAPLDHFAAAVRDRPFLVAAVGAVLVSLFAAVAFTPHYETNDDVTMNLIAAGLAFADRPDEHLVFTNVVIGLPLKWLYLAAPRVPWYGIYQFATIAAAAAALTYAFLRVNPSLWQAAAAGLFLAAGVLPCLVEIQFTRTGFLASFAGLALLLAPVRGAASSPRLADAAGCVLLLLGSLIRFESLLLAVVMALPVMAAAAYAAPKPTLRRAVPVAASLAVAVVLYFLNSAYYARDEGWKDFYAYNALRAQFTDYGRYQYNTETKPAFDAVGWEPVDYSMLVNWFYADRDRYSLAHLQSIAAAAPSSPPPSAWDVISGVWENLPNAPGLQQLMLAGVCVPFLTLGGWWRFLVPFALFGFVFTVIVGMGVGGYWVPVRVGFPLFAGAVAAAVLQPGVAEPPKRRVRGGDTAETTRLVLRCAGGVLAAGVVIWSYYAWSEIDGKRVSVRQGAEKVVRELKPRPDRLYVAWREWFPFEHLVFPLEDPASLRPFRCLSMSWLLPTPFTDQRMREFDITDVYRAICDRPDLSIVAVPGLLDYFREYVKLHYGREVVFHLTYRNPEKPAILVFKSGEGPDPNLRWPPIRPANAGAGTNRPSKP